jgi:hypothetical protein
MWEIVPSPDPGMSFLDLTGVVALTPSDVWAVGFNDVQGGDWKTLAMHWNGSTWMLVNSPSPDPTLNTLKGVSAGSGGDVWAVGNTFSAGTLALRFRSGSWTVVKSSNLGTGDNVLNGISGSSGSDIWAVGHAQSRSLTVHYDGTRWKVVRSPNLEFGVRLEDVVAIAPGDAWAVGWTGSGSDLNNISVAMHWNGRTWSIVPTPQPGGQNVDRLRAVDAAGPNDVWAVGVYQEADLDERSLILHWDGSTWSVVPNACAATYGGLGGIGVLSSTDIWAVGNASTCHWNGSTWTLVPSPQPRSEYYEIAYPLEDVSGTSTSDVWAVGSRVTEFYDYPEYTAFAEHWNGSEWSRVVELPGHFLYGVEAIAANDVWAVGFDGFGPLIVHYDGSSWTSQPTPEAGRGGKLGGIDRLAGELWAAGNYNPTDAGGRTLIVNAPSKREGAVLGSTNVSFATISWFGPETGTAETDLYGNYQVGGLKAGTYKFIAAYSGCTPDSAKVIVVAGQIVRQDFHLGC